MRHQDWAFGWRPWQTSPTRVLRANKNSLSLRRSPRAIPNGRTWRRLFNILSVFLRSIPLRVEGFGIEYAFLDASPGPGLKQPRLGLTSVGIKILKCFVVGIAHALILTTPAAHAQSEMPIAHNYADIGELCDYKPAWTWIRVTPTAYLKCSDQNQFISHCRRDCKEAVRWYFHTKQEALDDLAMYSKAFKPKFDPTKPYEEVPE